MYTVWGPEPIRLGYIGAPISTAFSFNLISVLTLVYGLLYAPREAWEPISSKMFKSLGLLVQLGLAGVGQLASEWWSWELVGREFTSYRLLSFGWMSANYGIVFIQSLQACTYPSCACFLLLLVLRVFVFRLGPVSLASQSVLLVSASTSYQAPFALSVAASVRYDF